MQFTFVDRVLELQPGVSIKTLKCLTLAEEYLADHFPRFPVMPGVLMLQSLTDASALLVAATEDFTHSVITLKEARNIRFADFVQPGRTLTITAEIHKISDAEVELKANGALDGRTAVNGRIVLERYNLADKRPHMAATDDHLRQHWKMLLARVYQPEAGQPEAAAAPAPSNGA